MVIDLFFTNKTQLPSSNSLLDKKTAETLTELFFGYGNKKKPLNSK